MANKNQNQPKTNGKTIKVFTNVDVERKVRELIGGKLGMSSRSIKLTPNFSAKKYDMLIPGSDKFTTEQKTFITKAEELLALTIK
jgi:hypothetical protein